MRVSLQRLEGFYYVAITGGYARAARAFPYPITQPGVHQQVRRLEEELGVTLFERVGKDRVALTAAGRALYAFVGPFLEQLPAVVAALRDGTMGGVLRVSAAPLVLRWLLPSWLRRLQAAHPEIEVALSQIAAPDLTMLRAGETDLLVDYLDEVPPDISARVVGTSRPFLVLPADHRLARPRRPPLSALADDTFVAYHADARIRELQLRALGGPPARTLGADSADTILAFVAAGVGWSLVPWLDRAGPKVGGVKAYPLALSAAKFPIYAAWRKSAVPNPLVDAALQVAPRGPR